MKQGLRRWRRLLHLTRRAAPQAAQDICLRQVRRPRTAFTDRADPWSKGGGGGGDCYTSRDALHPKLHRTFA